MSKNITVKQIQAVEKKLSEKVPDRKVTYSLDNETIEVKVKTKLSVYEMLNLVNSVAVSVVDGIDGVYRPEMKDYFTRLAVINAYTNINLPKSIEECYNLVYGTNIFEQITASEEAPSMWYGWDYSYEIIHMTQYNAMIEAIDTKIEYMLSQASKHSKKDDLLDELADLFQNATTNLKDVNIKEFIDKISLMDKVNEKALAEALIDTKYNDSNKVIDFAGAKAKSEDAD